MTHIRKIKLERFTVYDSLDLDLPDSGLIAITGPNGSGKSSVVEAVSTALFGRTLRGPEPWVDGVAGTVSVTTPDLEITRSTTPKGTKKLAWARGGKEAPHDTATKAQEALSQYIGDHETWRRTHTFSSADAAHFTRATDAERKRLLERLLGLDVFDRAFEAVSKDLAKARSDRDRAMDAVAAAERLVASEESSLDALLRLGERAEPQEPPLPPPGEINALTAQMRSAEAEYQTAQDVDVGGNEDIERARAASDEAQTILLHARRDAREAEAHLSAIESGQACSTCHRPFDTAATPETIKAARVAAENARAAEEAAIARTRFLSLELGALMSSLREERSERCRALRAEIDDLRKRISECEGQEAAHERWKREHSEWASERTKRARVVEEQRAKVRAAKSELLDHQDALDGMVEKVAYLTEARSVLGARGVRGAVLARALEGIEAVANSWLSVLAPDGVTVELSPYTTNKDGSSREEFALHFHGVGGGRGYFAASGGERARLDIAIMLALAEISASTRGMEPGTLFFDEVFDALDSSGVEAVREALSELSETRAVVVITHSADLVSALPLTAHYRVEEGVLRLA